MIARVRRPGRAVMIGRLAVLVAAAITVYAICANVTP
jgi:hypothetical protein